MARKRLFWQLMPSYLLITLLALLAVTWYARQSVSEFYLDQARNDLEDRAQIFKGQIVQYLDPLSEERIASICRDIGSHSQTRVSVILPDGRVVGDSQESPPLMENHSTRPEIATALRGDIGFSRRFSHTVQKAMIYAAVPIAHDGSVVGVVRTSIPLTNVERALKSISVKIIFGGLLVALVAACISLAVSQQLSKPLVAMTRATESFAKGDFTRRIPAQESDELGQLADAMNWMASELGEKVSTVQRQRNEQDAVLSSMVEGVLAVDADERVIDLNLAACRLFDIGPGSSRGRSIEEVVRNPDLQQFVKRALASNRPIEEDIVLSKEGAESYLQVHGTVLRDPSGDAIGALIVLHDVSRLRRLEKMRRDFVANVSHELKTPITSIKGFVETLQDGAMKDEEDAKRFLAIIAKQSERLTTIIEDLLSLSRIEQDQEEGLTNFDDTNIKAVLNSAVEICSSKADDKKMEVHVTVDGELRHHVKAHLLEQAVVNLVDNAIKYSEAGKRVDVQAGRDGSDLVITVRDSGSGISREHLDRLFERFYRVDKARSREMGGTGLGLAIVKHICIAHGGSVAVDSSPGKGSTFTIRIPEISTSA